METVDTTQTFSNVDIDVYEVQPLPKVVDNRGFMYIIEDSAYPGYIKIGRTINLKKRMAMYNADKPFKSSRLVTVSREFEDAVLVEKRILEHLYKHTSPTTLSREWFHSEHVDLCTQLIEEAEDYFP